jgi:hypothetical protein
MLRAIAVSGLLSVGLATAAMAGAAERYLHIKIEDPGKKGRVNVDVPLSLAETILAAVNTGDLHAGRIAIPDANANGIDGALCWTRSGPRPTTNSSP